MIRSGYRNEVESLEDKEGIKPALVGSYVVRRPLASGGAEGNRTPSLLNVTYLLECSESAGHEIRQDIA